MVLKDEGVNVYVMFKWLVVCIIKRSIKEFEEVLKKVLFMVYDIELFVLFGVLYELVSGI